jgi:hypothetical protein
MTSVKNYYEFRLNDLKMKILLFVLIINSVLHSFDMMNEELFKPSVKVLTIDTFNQEINKNPFTFVLFYAPWFVSIVFNQFCL